MNPVMETSNFNVMIRIFKLKHQMVSKNKYPNFDNISTQKPKTYFNNLLVSIYLFYLMSTKKCVCFLMSTKKCVCFLMSTKKCVCFLLILFNVNQKMCVCFIYFI